MQVNSTHPQIWQNGDSLSVKNMLMWILVKFSRILVINFKTFTLNTDKLEQKITVLNIFGESLLHLIHLMSLPTKSKRFSKLDARKTILFHIKLFG